MKIIKISDETHKRLEADKAHFTEVIGITYTFDRTLQEYFKQKEELVQMLNDPLTEKEDILKELEGKK